MVSGEFLSPDDAPGKSKDSPRASVLTALQGSGSAEHPTAPEAAVEHKDPYLLIEEAVPKTFYGLETVGTTTDDFKAQLSEAFASGTLDSFFQNAAQALKAAYVALQPAAPEDDSGSQVYNHHQPASLENQIAQLREVELQLSADNFPDMPDEILQSYHRAVAEKIRHAQAMLKLGLPEFTALHRSPREWGELFGDNPNPRARLPYAETAEKMLRESNLGVEASRDDAYKTVGEALEIFNISEAEYKMMGIDPNQTELTSEQGQKWFEFLFARLGHKWTVKQSSGPGINVSAAGRTIAFPSQRKLRAAELRSITGHEFVHELRGENGSEQLYRLLQIGLPGYLKTEEGLATLVELILGERASHERMRKLAARYVAVDMAIQVEYDEHDQPIKAKHSPQHIYDTLVGELGVSAKDASDIVWRIFRNTSLTQQLVRVQAEDSQGKTWERVIPEVFPKDAVYFEGMQYMFDWIKSLLPHNSPLFKFVSRQKDFNPLALYSVGKMVEAGLNDGPQLPDAEERLRAHHQPWEIDTITNEGRLYLLQLLEPWMAGKIDFKSDGTPGWAAAMKPPKTRYSQLFQANR